MRKIGKVSLVYDDQGIATSAAFIPIITIVLDSAELLDLKEMSSGKDELSKIQADSENMLAKWFSEMTGIELADREEFQIVSTVLLCEKHENGNVKFCEIEYSFEQRL